MIDADKIIRYLNSAGYYACRRLLPTFVNQNIVICAATADYAIVEDCISFWLVSNGDKWILGCWSYRYWIIAEDADVLSVIEAYLRSDGSFTHVPSDIVEKYRLLEISNDDPRLLRAMQYGVVSNEPIEDLPEFFENQLRHFDIAETRRSLEEFAIETHVKTQLQNKGPLFIAIDHDAKKPIGIDHLDLTLTAYQCISTPGTERVRGETNSQNGAWVKLISNFAQRYNMIMYFEASMIGEYPILEPKIESIKAKFKISDSSWRNMSIESKLLLQANEIEHKKVIERQ